MKIRRATKKDIPKLADLMIKEFSKPPYNEKWTKKGALDSINKEYSDGEVYISEENKKILGFVSVSIEPYTKPIAFIENLIIDSRFQGKGVGKKIINDIEKMYKKREFYTVSLITNKKAPAYEFYKSQGYKESKSHVTMTKKL